MTGQDQWPASHAADDPISVPVIDGHVHVNRFDLMRPAAQDLIRSNPTFPEMERFMRSPEAFLEHLPARGYHPEPDFVIAELVNDAGVVGAADLARVWVEQHA